MADMYTESDTARDTATYPADEARRNGATRTRSEDAYLRIRELVLEGEFPYWQRLAEQSIAERLGVSRTPVREALARLHADGILRRFEDGGYYVGEPDLIDLRDLYELRITLELRGVLRGAEEGVEHDEQALLELREEWLAIQQAPPPPDGTFIDLDESFHTGLLRASGNLILVDTLIGVNARIRPVRLYDFLDAERIRVSIVEHLEILEAVIEREFELAADRLRRHIGISLDVVEDKLARAMATMLRQRRRR